MRPVYLAVAMAMVAACTGIPAGPAAAQASYPAKPIRFITPYSPGGGTDAVARFIGQRLAKTWGQPVVVENRPGGNTIIATETLVKAAPDGHAIMLTASSHVIVPQLVSVAFDPIRDFTPIATLVSSEYVLVLNPAVPASTLAEFIAIARARPGALNYASIGSGGVQHLSVELFSIAAGIRMQHIPYKGSAPSITDLLGGQVNLTFQTPSVVVPHVKTGKLKALAVSGPRRLAMLPQVPTLTEAGLPNVDMKYWFGVLAPAGTPRAIVDKLAEEIARIQATPEFLEMLDSQGLEPFASTPDQFAALMKADLAKFARVIRVANIKLEN